MNIDGTRLMLRRQIEVLVSYGYCLWYDIVGEIANYGEDTPLKLI